MKLLKLIEAPLKDWSTAPVLQNEMRIVSPNAEELEKAIAMCNINDIDTLYVYTDIA